MRHFIPNFGLFILAIVFTLSMAFGMYSIPPLFVPFSDSNGIQKFQALKCSLPTVLEYECDDAVAYGGDGVVDCCCFSTLCNNEVNLSG
jgi:hypothetical protein